MFCSYRHDCHLPPGNVSSRVSPQYGVPVTKYDRSSYKARPRQLLLTASFAVLVDRTKIKQKFEYTAMRGDDLP